MKQNKKKQITKKFETMNYITHNRQNRIKFFVKGKEVSHKKYNQQPRGDK